ncbi:MAG: BrnA antitoxin family protein [Pseudomonadota bacterium]
MDDYKPRRTASQIRANLQMLDEIAALEKDIRERELRDLIPSEWHSLEEDIPTRPRKQRVTAAIDSDVLCFFRKMGHGYQARMNRVLRTYMLARLAKEIRGQWDPGPR